MNHFQVLLEDLDQDIQHWEQDHVVSCSQVDKKIGIRCNSDNTYCHSGLVVQAPNNLLGKCLTHTDDKNSDLSFEFCDVIKDNGPSVGHTTVSGSDNRKKAHYSNSKDASSQTNVFQYGVRTL